MKPLIALVATTLLASLTGARAPAQVIHSSTVNGAILGGAAGAIIGHNSSGHNTWRGAAIGLAAGALIGAAVDDSRYDGRGYYGGPRVGVSVGYGGYYGRPYSSGRYYSRYPRVGFGLGFYDYGWDYYRPRYYDYDYAQPSTVAVPQSSAAAPQVAANSAPQNVTIINNYYGNSSPMSSANTLFGR